MIAAAVLGLSLVVNVAFESTDLSPNAEAKAAARLSPQQKLTTLRPLIRSATDCVVHAVSADPRYDTSLASLDMSKLVVDSIAPCAEAINSMIDEHDRLFGEGSGDAFFMGPYLDILLPLSIEKIVKGAGAPTDGTAGH